MSLGAAFAYAFRDPALRELALRHRSTGAHNNERLEFLGDALVGLFAAELLYARFPDADEGELTRWRAHMVNEGALARIARELDLGDQLHLGQGELKSGGFRRDSILADAFEALVGACYLDGGFDACRGAVRAIFEPRVDEAVRAQEKDPKTHLQEVLQARGLPLPVYELTGSSGAEHAKLFDVMCAIDAFDLRCEGRGSSRRAAEQAAATAALAQIAARNV
ncbi:MAG: ribonuclease III [Xanthomonadaceae bacterium]|nr:ribonuclease III [Xanthomonadaceae bacterium]